MTDRGRPDVVVVRLDGVGLARGGPDNPFSVAPMPTLRRHLGRPLLLEEQPLTDNTRLFRVVEAADTPDDLTSVAIQLSDSPAPAPRTLYTVDLTRVAAARDRPQVLRDLAALDAFIARITVHSTTLVLVGRPLSGPAPLVALGPLAPRLAHATSLRDVAAALAPP